ncbi:IPT/TIG domain-containing protein [Chitinophaga sp. MM2321]|uniref:IPT/TIG domain-containing protein n=1 Tax=Chitinophaga sp. MM2321 TaxID=3137178 RepID=UPI0032D5A53B
MKHCKMFVALLTLLITAMMACAPNPGKKTSAAIPVTGSAGNFLMIKGHGFSEEIADNKVIFGDVAAQVLQANPEYLVVQVPAQREGRVQVVVTVGAHDSNAMLFEYSSGNKLVAALGDIASAAY